MFWKRSIFVLALLTIGLLLVGCELSLQNTEVQDIDNVPAVTTEGTDTATPETVVEFHVEPVEPTPESPRPETEEPTVTEGEAPASTTEGEPAPVVTEEQPAVTTEQPAETPATTEQPATVTAEQPATTTTAGTPATHTVAAGENLYRIGLRYGISWVRLAQYNNLPNANSIVVGQVLRIPAAEQGGTPAPTPVPTPTDGTTYTVKAGDTLARIGQSFGVDWRLIAEANGIVNPNRIFVGDELKIPSNTPGPAPQLTHVVRTGETLFLISLNYGVLWTNIAEANDITSPYVIYPGQTLIIPGE